MIYDLFKQFEWPEPDKKNGVTETKMVYMFDYLPAGLFNRGQVRWRLSVRENCNQLNQSGELLIACFEDEKELFDLSKVVNFL